MSKTETNKPAADQQAPAPVEKTAAELQAELAELQAKLKENEEEKEILLSSNKELQESLEANAETLKKVAVTVTIDKKVYQIVTPKIKIGDRDYTSSEVAKDKDLVKKLIELGSGAIQPLK